MNISGTSNQNYAANNMKHQRTAGKGNDFLDDLSKASQAIEKQEDGDVIGLEMIKDPNGNRFWGMKAKYGKASTSQNPVIYVETNYGGKTSAYNISINDIDPSNASRLEMFALCSYADSQGAGDNSTFGTFQTLKIFEEMSIHNGYFSKEEKTESALAQFSAVKLNWADACDKTIELLYRCNDLKQYRKGKDILNLFSKYPASRSKIAKY